MYRLLAALLFVISSCHADTITLFFTSIPSVLENYHYNMDSNGGSDSSGQTYNGWAIVTIGGIPVQEVICNDEGHTTFMPSSADLIYDYSFLIGQKPLQYARYSDMAKVYETAAVLLTQFKALNNPSANTVTDYQYALWELFTPSVTINQTQAQLQAGAFALVQANSPVATTAYANLVIYTPTAAYGGNQEFLGLNTPAPEPSETAVLVFIGAILLAVRSWGRQR